jgi:DNA-binding HxlR family transcriptional regulator
MEMVTVTLRDMRNDDMSERKVQIPEKVFYELVKFHLLGETDAEEEIKTHLMKKLDALAEHQLYTRSKKATSQNEREQARKEYLERRGISAAFRW